MQTPRARALASALAALLALPLAVAGTERAPEVEDADDVARDASDILAIWLDDDARGLKFTFKLAGIRQPIPRQIYELNFNVGFRGESVAVGWDADGRLHSSVDTPNAWGATPSRVDDRLLEERAQLGEPAYVSAVVPWGAVSGLEPGAVLRGIGGGSTHYDDAQRRWLLRVDEAGGGGIFGPSVTVGRVDASAGWAPLLLLSGAAAGGAVGWAAFRRLRARP